MRITKPAEVDLFEIQQYIQADNPAAATRMVLRILEAAELLTEFPSIGKVGRKAHTRELVISATPFVLVYQVRQHVIIVLRVLHTARKWPNNKNNH